jgi:hypothetical protein
MGDVMKSSSIPFTSAARVLGDTARSLGLFAPSFRSPPRVSADRTVRGQGTSDAMVAVRVKGRPWLAVLADLVDGIIVANALGPADAARCRTALWAAVEENDLAGVGPRRDEHPPGPGRRTGPATTVAGTPGWRNRQTQAA